MEPNKVSYAAELPEPIAQKQGESLPTPAPEVTNQPPSAFQQTQQSTSLQSVQPALPAAAINNPTPPQIAVPPISTLIADDADLIEKEWVLKAKAIVAQTVHDPNLQTKEMGKVRAEYLKKRYNKNLKLDDV